MSEIDTSTEVVERLAALLVAVAGLERQAEYVGQYSIDPGTAEEAAELLRALAAERDALRLEAQCAQKTLNAWFDLAEKAEAEGANVLRGAVNTWLRRAENGGMPSDLADAVRNVVDEAARQYFWKALVPVVRGVAAESLTRPDIAAILRGEAVAVPVEVWCALCVALEELMDVQKFATGWDNGVTDSTGTINEGDHWHGLAMDRARAAMLAASPYAVKRDE
jgi:hypothetical protein